MGPSREDCNVRLQACNLSKNYILMLLGELSQTPNGRSKLHQGTADVGPCFHLPVPFWVLVCDPQPNQGERAKQEMGAAQLRNALFGRFLHESSSAILKSTSRSLENQRQRH